jgi:hypothetical protein
MKSIFGGVFIYVSWHALLLFFVSISGIPFVPRSVLCEFPI